MHCGVNFQIFVKNSNWNALEFSKTCITLNGSCHSHHVLAVIFSSVNSGQFEKKDNTELANYLAQTYDWIDENRVAIWGWSYGGYATTHTICKYLTEYSQIIYS